MNLRFSIRAFLDWEFFPLHPRVKYFEDVVENLVVTDLAFRAPLRERQVRQDKLLELFLAQLHGNDLVFGLFLLF